MTLIGGLDREWLEPDGLGGFASGTVGGQRARRYHGLLLAATTPPTGRMMLVNGFEAAVTTGAGTFALSTQHYMPDVVHPDGYRRIVDFQLEPWPTWRYRLEDGTEIEQSLWAPHEKCAVTICWRLLRGTGAATLRVRPLVSGRDYHAMHHENPALRFDAQCEVSMVAWHPYPGVPAIVSMSNGRYTHAPLWYRNFLYSREVERGLDSVEDLASPGEFAFDLSKAEAVWVLTSDLADGLPASAAADVVAWYQRARDAERRRRAQFASPLDRAADAYLVRRATGRTIIAGYPWFTDWGRDTFISLRGLCLASGRFEDVRQILLAWAGMVSRGMLPNRFVDGDDPPEFNSVDASLWFVIAAGEFLDLAAAGALELKPADRKAIVQAIAAIVAGYARGTRFGIRADSDGLLAAGVPGQQLTWMDAKVGDWVVTPRIGKPVEVQALWINAISIAGRTDAKWAALVKQALESFRARFIQPETGYLYDVVDVDHVRGQCDGSLRPNQVFAAGGLPLALVDGETARHVVRAVEERLWTPMGLRSLAPGSPGYAPRYQGDVWHRDAAYHQGTVWPWLLGPFVQAWVRVNGGTLAAKREARRRFVDPLVEHLGEAGIGHISEIADAEPPHAPRGCPWQAWSLGELLRLTRSVLADQGGEGVRTNGKP